MEAEARCQLAEEERDVYRVLARRYQLRLEAALRRNGHSNQESNGNGASDIEEDEEEEAGGARMVPLRGRVMSGREQAVISGLGAMLRSIQYESGGDEEEGDDDDDIDDVDDDIDEDNVEGDDRNAVSQGANAVMDDDGDDDANEEMAENNGDDDSGSNDIGFLSLGAHNMTAMSDSTALVVHKQRSVSITSSGSL
jgi:hypothetical protein